ncbi:ABC transporter substrate-binding protein [Desulfosporosinus sp. PR]|uniref:ABC transporter substrate-binding protein n=1 Tax=Candidatus Desulfosporosinus nitrosoreducens TaxID=3401928 RepID=UPI0027F6C2AA|nr:ABC transporter substrate-binding protein [Desulfosporosinus sp. PR]MDQ7092199.1 ABC transporter substrate-binding protein [Desulfosporosinus sp. PR]
MKNYKKLTSVLSILLVAVLLLSLAGCQAAGSTPAAQTSAGQTTGTKTVTDLVGNQVKIKNNIERIAIIPIPWASVAFAVDGSGKKIVGMHPSAMESYQNCILKTVAPEMAAANSTFVDNSFNVNYEEIAKLKPDLAVIWDYQPEVGKKLAELGIPSVAIKYGTLQDVQNGIKLLGEILNKQDRAAALIKWQNDVINSLQSKTKELTSKDKTKVLYLRDKQLQVGAGQSINKLMIESVGGENVADKVSGSWTKVSMEQVMAWNPDVIILSDFSDIVPEDLYKNKLPGQDWSSIQAVKNQKVYKAPMGIYRWDAPCVETPLMMEWIGKVIHPEMFANLDLRNDLRTFYQQFFNYKLTDAELDQILNSKLNPGLKI